MVDEDGKQVINERDRQKVKKVACGELRREFGEFVVKRVHQAAAKGKAKARPQFQ